MSNLRGKTTTASTPGSFAPHARSESEVSLPDVENPFTHRYDSVEEKVKAMQAELAKAVDDLADDENWTRHLNVMARFHGYSLSNQMLIAIQRPDATRVAGFKTWQAIGRQVRKGEKGIAILAPRLVNARDSNGDLILDDDGKPRKKIAGFTTATVFDVAQTEGEPLPERIWEQLSEEPPAGFVEDLVSAVERAGYRVEYRDMSDRSARGFTSASGSKLVVVDSSTTAGTQATTLAHELGHILCGHMGNVEDYHVGHGGRRGDMEMEAESFAYVIARANGMATHISPASEYIAGWSRRAQADLRATGETVQKAVKAALTGSSWRNAEAP